MNISSIITFCGWGCFAILALYGQVARVIDSIGLEVISPNLCSFGNR